MDTPFRAPRPHPLAFVCAVEREAEPLRRRLRAHATVTVGGRPAHRGTIGHAPVLLVVSGVGKVNAAQCVTALLENRLAAGVVSFGVGGAYPGSGLEPGGVALATSEIYGDEGVLAPENWLSMQDLGFPLVDRDGLRRFHEFPVPEATVEDARRALSGGGVETVAGPFVTVSTCSGTAARGRELADRHRAVCESMEGAACAHVATLYGVPFLEVRGISNHVEDRDLSRWRLDEACEAAAVAAAALARHDALDFRPPTPESGEA